MTKPLKVRIMKYGPGNGWSNTTYRVETCMTTDGPWWLQRAELELDRAIKYAEELINPVVVVPELVWSGSSDSCVRNHYEGPCNGTPRKECPGYNDYMNENFR